MAVPQPPFPAYQDDAKIFVNLLTLRNAVDPWAREINDNLLVHRLRWLLQANQTTTAVDNFSHDFNDNIFDSTTVLALRTAIAGFLSGCTSPASPWVILGVDEEQLAVRSAVKAFLDYANKRLLTAFDRSNFYTEMASHFADLLCLPSAVTLIEQDPVFKVRYNTLSWGTYVLDIDENGDVNTIGREEQFKVRQLVPKFCKLTDDGQYDLSNLSTEVADWWKSGLTENMERWVVVRHVIRPNPNFTPDKPQAKYKRWLSRYFEKTTGELTGKYLRESGYDWFPAFVSRWSKRSQEVYANECPGLQVLADIKQLYKTTEDLNHGTDLVLDPPLTGPDAFNDEIIQKGPGGFTADNSTDPKAGLRPLFEIAHDLKWVSENKRDLRNIVERGFFTDLFLAISRLRDSVTGQVSATEVDALRDEKMVELGPVTQMVFRALRHCIDVTFTILNEAGEMPPPPAELVGRDLPPEFISPFARAQKVALLGLVDKLLAYGEKMVQMGDQTPLVKIDFGAVLDQIGKILNLPAGFLRPEDVVAQMRAASQKAAADQHQAELMQQASQTAKNLGQTPTDGNNLVTQLLKMAQAGNLAPAA
ncbi:MAG TPA: portal protein [bacterium]|nr:portal protein [bacterium]